MGEIKIWWRGLGCRPHHPFPRRLTHSRGVTVSLPPPSVGSLWGPSGHPSHPHSPGLVFRLGVGVPGGLDTLLSHIGEHRERGLHNEVDEACGACNKEKADLGSCAEDTAGTPVPPAACNTVTWGSKVPSGGNLCDDVFVTPENSTPALHAPAQQLALTGKTALGMGTGSRPDPAQPGQHP